MSALWYTGGVMARIVIVDYDAGNLRSVAKAIEHVGYRPLVTDNPSHLNDAEAVIVPGVGAANDTMTKLQARGMVEPLQAYIASGRPFLGVCMGMQALLTRSEENGGQECMDVIPGTVRRLPDGLKVPHMGWNTVYQRRPHPIFRGIPDHAYFYFLHSYHVQPEDDDLVIGETDYGRVFPAAIARDNIVATQFHPEKSSGHGLRIYQNFLEYALGGVGAK